MEKLCLKWNDFQTNVTKSFGVLREEKNLFDVTLVSDEGEHVSAHRLVLSACSEFFRNIFKKVNNQNPLIFLAGVNSTDLRILLDYMYEGEAQIYQDGLGEFLEVANKLQINGLLGVNQETINDDVTKEFAIANQDFSEESDFDEEGDPPKKFKPKKREFASSNIEAKRATLMINELIFKEGDFWFCKSCKFSSNFASTIRPHAETHIDGLSFVCPICEESFRSRKILSNHKRRKH